MLPDNIGRSSWKTRLFPYLAAVGLGVLYFLVNMHYLQQYVDSDSFVYVHNISLGVADPSYTLFNPHHLHLEVGGQLFHEWMVRNLGNAGFTDLLFNLKLRSLLAACVGIVFAVLFLRDVTGKTAWGIIGGLLIGFFHGYLHYSTKVDTGIFPAAAFLPIAWVINRIARNRSRGVLILSLAGGVFFFLGVMAHQYALIACVIGAFCIALPPIFLGPTSSLAPFVVIRKKRTPKPLIDSRPRLRYASFAVLAVFGALLTIGGYFYAGKTFYRLSFDKPTPEVSQGLWYKTTFQKWLLAYATEDKWGYGLKYFTPSSSAKGILEAFLTRKPLSKFPRWEKFPYDMSSPLSAEAVVPNLQAFFTLIAVAGSILFFPMLLRRYGRIFLFLFLNLAAYAVFFTFWEPGYFEFWILPTILIACLFILLMNAFAEKLAPLGPVLAKAARLPFYACTLFLALMFASHNIRYYLVPHSRVVVSDGIPARFSDEEYARLYAAPYYKHPGNVYQEVYDTVPGSYRPASSAKK
jgi:hypothetical protein